MHPVARLWRQKFQRKKPPAFPIRKDEGKNLLRLSRSWRKILRRTGLRPGSSILEAGCGAGSQLIPLAARGFRVTGIDSSPEALKEGERMIRQLREQGNFPGRIDFIAADFYDLNLKRKYDLVFQRGVVEHYPEKKDRVKFFKKMLDFIVPGGYLVSIVPAGTHPLRLRFKEENLGGYDIAEIDYSARLLEEELRAAGGKDVTVRAHNLMGYLNALSPSLPIRFLIRLIYYLFQFIPGGLFSRKFRLRHAYSFIGLARKEKR